MATNITFDPKKDIPSLTGKVFLITGGTAGLGRETILALSKHAPAHIYFTGRNASRAATVIAEAGPIPPLTSITFLPCDQTSLASVHSACQTFLSQSPRLDVLICNAGVMAIPGGTTQDGYENQFGINQLAHALFIQNLLPTLQRTAASHGGARIIFLASQGFRMPPTGGIVFPQLRSPQNITILGRWLRYGQSKLANVVYASELAKRYPDITTLAIHPGLVWTDLVNNLGFFDRCLVWMTTLGQLIPSHEGAYNPVWAATAKTKDIQSGGFYEPVGKLGEQSKESADPKLGEELWEWTQKALEGYGSIPTAKK